MKEFCKPKLDVCMTVKKQAVKRLGGKKIISRRRHWLVQTNLFVNGLTETYSKSLDYSGHFDSQECMEI